MKINYNLLCFFLLALSLNDIAAQNGQPGSPIMKITDPDIPALIRRMTPEEKFRQLFMVPGDISLGKEKLTPGIFGFSLASTGQEKDAAGQILKYSSTGSAGKMAEDVNTLQKFFQRESRLGIPIIVFDEALHGLIREGATAFPQSIGLAATFDTSLMHQVARAIAAETASRGIRQLLSPVLNIARDVRWGRTEETYGEDPYLVSSMGHAFISEIQKAGIIATPKHFAVNSGDGGRDSYPIHYNERIMEEIYLPAFKTAFQQAGALSVMTAYNSFDGTPCTSNEWLLKKKLKGEWKFRGFVISDASATGGANVLHMTAGGYEEAGKQAIENGLDVIFQTDLNHFELFKRPFLDGKVSTSIIDSAVYRVLNVKKELGLFSDPYADPGKADSINGCRQHRDLALEAARKSIVLLKNEKAVLPLSHKVRSVAVIGTDAKEARLGGYSGPGNRKISILDGIRMVAGDSITVSYTPGCGRYPSLLPVIPSEHLKHEKENGIEPGLSAAYFSNATLEGDPVLTRIDKKIDFSWTLYGPDPVLANSWYSVCWTGFLQPDTEGSCRIGIRGNDGFRLYLDDQLVLDRWVKQTSGTFLTDYHFKSAEPCRFRLEFRDCTGNSHIQLIWDQGLVDTSEIAIAHAVEVAQRSEVIICVVGIEEGEFRDRSSLNLPGSQEKMIRALAETGKPVVVMITGGSAVTMNNWISEVPVILDAWYPGEAGGLAVAEVLFGQYNPAGRLPVTFPAAAGQLPLVYNHKPTGRGDDYLDLSGEPLFPFGFGLSYTGFSYADLQLLPEKVMAGDTITVTFKLTNTGARAGEEVWQLYLHDELASVARPVRELKGFGRVMLESGETRNIFWKLAPGDLSMLNKDLIKVTEPGDFSVQVGSSSKDIRLKGNLKVNGQK